MTPYGKLKWLHDAEQYPAPGVAFETLDAVAHAMSDLQTDKALNRGGERTCSLSSANTTGSPRWRFAPQARAGVRRPRSRPQASRSARRSGSPGP